MRIIYSIVFAVAVFAVGVEGRAQEPDATGFHQYAGDQCSWASYEAQGYIAMEHRGFSGRVEIDPTAVADGAQETPFRWTVFYPDRSTFATGGASTARNALDSLCGFMIVEYLNPDAPGRRGEPAPRSVFGELLDELLVGREGDEPAEPSGEPELERRSRTFSRGDTNEHCTGSRQVRWRVNAESGWEIDVNSIRDSVTVQSSKSVYAGVSDVSAEGFTISGQLVNSGECIRILGSTVARDGRGTLRVHVEYEEIRSQ